MTDQHSPAFFRDTNRFADLRPTIVFDSYWRFAAERQAVFFRRLRGDPAPWTDDPILLRHRFTNTYRAADRVSQYLIREVIYGKGRSMDPREQLFRVLLFKLFNKIETWQLLEDQIGDLRWETFDFTRYDKLLSAAMRSGARLYSAAYIIPPVKWPGGDGVKHRGHLHLIRTALGGKLIDELGSATSLGEVFALLKQLPSLGDFLAFQLAIDLNYGTAIDFPEDSFVVAGPGARDGIAKCFHNAPDYLAEDIIEFMHDRQDREFARLGLDFESLWGRPLQLIDCQNLFCEISKYARVAHPDVMGVSGRTRIKQIYKPLPSPHGVWFPPKWGLNDKLPADTARSGQLL
ncbi:MULTISPECIES: nucleotide kinase domain-containing protein [unclassified Sphingobium]|uniref:nucleotide kinase domain-containing protein n=1 Tax=unclassified Sphingobium TaxID=2611147 RepID=UPI0035A67D84